MELAAGPAPRGSVGARLLALVTGPALASSRPWTSGTLPLLNGQPSGTAPPRRPPPHPLARGAARPTQTAVVSSRCRHPASGGAGAAQRRRRDQLAVQKGEGVGGPRAYRR